VKIKDEPFLLVFVHFGSESPKTLGAFARAGLNRNSKAMPILITERHRPELGFPGETIIYKNISKASMVFSKRNPHYKTLASGYWAHTFERIFALSELERRFPKIDIPIVHLESDVLPLFDKEDMNYLKTNYRGAAIPRFSQTRGIGSILYSSNISRLQVALEKLSELVENNVKYIENDMELLGVGLNEGYLEELPSHPSDHLTTKASKPGLTLPLFDGAALGQYLFGRDPFHQQGFRRSGFVNPEYTETTNLTDFLWRTHRKNEHVNLMVDTMLGVFKVANLHIHSKELIPELSENNERWVRALKEANLEQERHSEMSSDVSPHSRRATFAERLYIARKRGFGNTLFNYFKKRIL